MKLWIVMLVLSFGQVQAASVPLATNSDPRFQRVQYSDTIVKVNTEIGRFVDLVFSESEIIQDYKLGDAEAWARSVQGNVLSLKPKAKTPDTNLKVVTNKRIYWFELVMEKNGPLPPWRVKFEYEPDPPKPKPPMSFDEFSARLGVAQNEVVNQRFGQANSGPEEHFRNREINGDYGASGSSEITPTAAYDNGELTVLTFSPNKSLPVPFVEMADGSEGKVDFHIEDDMMIIHRVARKLILRSGQLVVALVNGSFKPIGPNNQTKTVSDDVVRELRKVD